ncbi:MAG TPA: hypothetical protein VIG99_19570 [Myxococcaceae bacterium]|jgi:hypothetical protein
MSPALLVLQLLAAAPELTLLQDPASPPTWYGDQTLIADGAAAVLVGGAFVADHFIATGSPARYVEALVALIGVSGYLLGGPFIHVHHGQVGEAVRDLIIRVTSLSLGFIVGALVGFKVQSDPVGGAVVGAMFGGLFAAAIDATMFAWAPARPAHAGRPSFRLMPVVGTSRGGAPVAGLGGTF